MFLYALSEPADRALFIELAPWERRFSGRTFLKAVFFTASGRHGSGPYYTAYGAM